MGWQRFLNMIKAEMNSTIKLDILGKKVEVKGFNKNNTNYITVEDKDIPIRTVLEALGLTVSGRGNEVIAK